MLPHNVDSSLSVVVDSSTLRVCTDVLDIEIVAVEKVRMMNLAPKSSMTSGSLMNGTISLYT